MKTYIFTGPSLPPADAQAELDAVFLPPVSEGDILRLMDRKPAVIGIIDGFFENIPAVWHKEILFAISRGVHVYGAASMGALRAAELQPFGMIGVGAVFEAFASGQLEDDDEVAVLHGPAELGYPMLSEAMVNIRRTLSDAHADDVISLDSRARMENIAKSLIYKERTYHNILSLSRRTDMPKKDLDGFEAWLPRGRADQKKEDALQLLKILRNLSHHLDEENQVPFHFERTTMWERARSQIGHQATI
ncbi:MAG: tfuA protein [Rhodospirillales bacterium]|nr:tfuA protein [Rhodospirillales bacterium]